MTPIEITLFTLHPGGMPACSRWLSRAIPPEPHAPNPPAPRPGCQPHHYTIRSSPKNIKNPRNNTFYALNHTLCSGLRLSETSRSARIVASHPDATWGPFVPSVPLDTANSSKIPEITLLTLHPGGMPACSRWLSGAIPPEPNAPNPPAPRPGCQSHHYSIRPSPKNIKNPRNNTFYALNHTLCSGLRLSETSRSARIVASHPDATWGPFVPSVHWTPQTHRKSPK